MNRQSRQENLIYLVMWCILFASPVLSLYVRNVHDTSLGFDWTEVFIVWRNFAIYLLLFLIHNFLLAPLLIHNNRRMAYTAIVTVIVVAFSLYQCNSGPAIKGHKGHLPPPHIEQAEFRKPPMDEGSPRGRRPSAPPPIVGERDIMAIMVLILMLGANLGTKHYFRSSNDRKRLAELEKENLEQQLEYLRYQINPHFFMNTLNNIHALVDIEPAKAQESIVELSKMMRFVLYEGDKRGVPLTRDFEFIRTYVKLMQLRYTDKVRIALELPAEVPDRTIPPLMLISFIENAFKHGISYQHESFIEIKADVKADRLYFSCVNSKTDTTASSSQPVNEKSGGVGLANVRKRLNLLYDKDYTLDIQDGDKVFTVELNIPLS